MKSKVRSYIIFYINRLMTILLHSKLYQLYLISTLLIGFHSAKIKKHAFNYFYIASIPTIWTGYAVRTVFSLPIRLEAKRCSFKSFICSCSLCITWHRSTYHQFNITGGSTYNYCKTLMCQH